MEEKGPLYAKFQPVETGLLLNSQVFSELSYKLVFFSLLTLLGTRYTANLQITPTRHGA